MDPIGPGNHERAWNDPPKFAFNSSGGSGIGNPSGRRRLLNKRVPVPTGPQVGNSPQHQPLRPGDGPPIGSPPLGTGAIGSPPLTKPPTDSQLSERMSFPRPEIPSLPESMTSEEILKEVESLFSNSVDKLSEDLKDNVREEMTKRFEVMKAMWLEGKMNNIVQNRMLALMKVLDKGNFDEAWGIHQGLIVDFTSMCSPWMIGIKTLVIESRKKAGNTNTEASKTEHTDDNLQILEPLDLKNIDLNDVKEDSEPREDDVK